MRRMIKKLNAVTSKNTVRNMVVRDALEASSGWKMPKKLWELMYAMNMPSDVQREKAKLEERQRIKEDKKKNK